MNRKHFQLIFQLLCLLVLAFVLRRAGANWDEKQLLHPDERFMCMVTERLEMPESLGEWFNTRESRFNPYNQNFPSYVYGTLPLWLCHLVCGWEWVGAESLEEIVAVGRLLSSLWSVASVALLYLFSLKLFNARLASLLSLLYACSVFSMQQATFYTVDTAAECFSTLCLGLGLLAIRKQWAALLLPAGAAIGLAMACRINLALLAPWLCACSLALAFPLGEALWDRQRILRVAAYLAGAGCIALLVFRIAQPTAFLGFGLNPQWLQDLRQVHAISSGELEVPFTLQWVKRIPWIFALRHLSAFALGWPLGLLCLVSLAWILGQSLWPFLRFHKRPHSAPTEKIRVLLPYSVILMGLWPLMVIAYHGQVFLHTQRYFLPALPALLFCAGWGLQQIRHPDIRRWTSFLIAGLTALYAIAFVNMYREEHPRIAASKWIYEQLPAQGRVTAEHWDDALPLRLAGAEAFHQQIQFLELPVYHRDSEEKLREILWSIQEADLIVLSSTRASDSIPRMPLRYPLMSRFYERLLSEESATRIGLEEVGRFHRAPRLGRYVLNSLVAEEAFRVYDHPLVRIYRKTSVFDPEVVLSVLSEGLNLEEVPQIPYRQAGRWNQGWLERDQLERRQGTESWLQRFSPKSLGMRQPLLIWILLLLFLQVAAFPLCWAIFPSLRDRGAGAAKLVGLLLLSWAAWFPAALEQIPFRISLPLGFFLLVAASATVVALQQEAWLSWCRRHWKRLVEAELLFWALFLLFLLMRSRFPELWHPWSGGEKPMDFAFLSATAQSDFFPPQQPWLAGAFINYYYFGFVLCSSLIRLSGVSPDLAYALLLASFAAFSGSLIFSLSRALFPLFRQGKGWAASLPQGLLALACALFFGNLAQLRWLLLGKPGAPHGGYWHASRAILVPEGDIQPITEFPFFSFLYGDLHAHVMALPLAMLSLLLSWQLLRRYHPFRLPAAALVLGSLACTNSWDVPIQALLLAFCILMPAWKRLAELPGRVAYLLITLLLSYALFSPFHLRFQPPSSKLEIWSGPYSNPLDLLLHWGLFLVPIALAMFLWFRGRLPLRRAPVPERLFMLLLPLGSLLGILLLEVLVLQPDIGRMNTVFKFYYQLWWILALCAAPAFLLLLKRGLRSPAAAVSILLLSLGSLYPLTAPRFRSLDRTDPEAPRGIDGQAFLRAHPDWQLIQWLRREGKPGDILLEAQLPEYQWGGRFAWHSGLPTVLGWNWHMRQQRAGDEGVVWLRAQEVEAFFRRAESDVMSDIAQRHQVRYVFYGQSEAENYGPAIQQALIEHPDFVAVFEERIFEYRP